MHGDKHYRLGLYFRGVRLLGGELEYSVFDGKEVPLQLWLGLKTGMSCWAGGSEPARAPPPGPTAAQRKKGEQVFGVWG